MATEVKAVTPDPAKIQSEGGNTNADPATVLKEAAPKYATEEQFNSLAKLIRELKSPKPEAKKEESEETLKETVSRLQSEINNDREALKAERIDIEKDRLISGLKIKPENREYAEAYLDKISKGKLEYDSVKKKTFIKTESNLEPVEFSTFITELDKTGKFNIYKAAIVVPPNDGNTDGEAGSAKGEVVISRAAMRSGKLTPEQLRKSANNIED